MKINMKLQSRRRGRDEALGEFERATMLEPGNARFAYVYAVALHSTGKAAAAIAKLEKEILAHPNDRNILEAFASFHEARGERGLAKRYTDRLQELSERDKQPTVLPTQSRKDG